MGGKGSKAAMKSEPHLRFHCIASERGYMGTQGPIISVYTVSHAQIAEPLFCKFHNEAFGITIKLKGKGRRTALRDLRAALQGSPCPVLHHHCLHKWRVSRARKQIEFSFHTGFGGRAFQSTWSNWVRVFLVAAEAEISSHSTHWMERWDPFEWKPGPTWIKVWTQLGGGLGSLAG